MEISYASFSLPGGREVHISAEPAFAPALEILRRSHRMCDISRGENLLHVTHIPEQPNALRISGSGNLRQLAYRRTPQNLKQWISAARNIMFFSLLPMLDKGEIFLFHGGLTVDCNGFGCIFCGPSGVGKSTAVAKSSRIWEILSDDLMYLTFHGGRLFAQPGATWSTYLTGKERICECDVNRIIEVKNIIVLSRIGEAGIHPLTGQQGKLMLAGSFIDMITWHSRMALNDTNITSRLRQSAFEGVMRCGSASQIYRLTSEVDTDITPFLQQIM